MQLLENSIGFVYLLLAIAFFITQILVRRFPPKGINPVYGYRTKKSMKDQESWDFAQAHSSKMMRIVAFVFLGISALFYYFNLSFFNDLYIMITVFVLILGLMVYMTERELKARFKK
jgi:uncharacterized membrane protein